MWEPPASEGGRGRVAPAVAEGIGRWAVQVQRLWEQGVGLEAMVSAWGLAVT